MFIGLAGSAAGEELLAGEPGGVVGGEEDSDVGNVLGLTDAAERRGGDSPLGEVGFGVLAEDAFGVCAFGFYKAGVEGVDANFACAEFAGEDAGDGVDCALGCGVNGTVRRRDARYDRADVDNAGAFFEVLDRGLSDEE